MAKSPVAPSDLETEKSPLVPSDIEGCQQEVPRLEDYVPAYFSSDLCREIWKESKKVLSLIAPVGFNRVSTYAFGVVTQAYAGQFGTVELAAVSLATSTIGGVSFGLMTGMSSAQQTLSGQAFGAKKYNLLGVYLQQSFIVMNATALLFSLVYIFAAPLLKLLGQPEEVADLTGQFALWSLPQLFAYANYFPTQKFFQSQRKVVLQAGICAVSLVCHVFLNWLLIIKLGYGLLALAMVLNASWWFVVIGQFLYVVVGPFPETWTGFSLDIFHDVWSFLKLAASSAVMACVDLWYYRVLALLTGNLKNPAIAVDSFSICLSVYEGLMMFNSRAATSVIISNELGAGRPKRTLFVAYICLGVAMLFGTIFFTGIIIARHDIASIFTSNATVGHMVYELSIFLAFTLFINSAQPVLSGIAVGAGWQAYVAKVNIVCYYFIGIPISALLGFKFNLQVKGIWIGLLVGTSSQILILAFNTYRTDWVKEVINIREFEANVIRVAYSWVCLTYLCISLINMYRPIQPKIVSNHQEDLLCALNELCLAFFLTVRVLCGWWLLMMSFSIVVMALLKDSGMIIEVLSLLIKVRTLQSV